MDLLVNHGIFVHGPVYICWAQTLVVEDKLPKKRGGRDGIVGTPNGRTPQQHFIAHPPFISSQANEEVLYIVA